MTEVSLCDAGKRLCPSYRHIKGNQDTLSWSWGRKTPLPAPLAKSALYALKFSLPVDCDAYKLRVRAFEQAFKFISEAEPLGVWAPVSQSYPRPALRGNDRGKRVDIEVIEGRAFVGWGL